MMLWAYANSFHFQSLSKFVTSSSSPHKIKILILGESTSTSFGVKDEESWPNQLAELVKEKRNLSVELVNLSQIAVDTGFLVGKAMELSNSIQPHLVVSMMGINDGLLPRFVKTQESKTFGQLEKLRTFRFLSTIIESIFQSDFKRVKIGKGSLIYSLQPSWPDDKSLESSFIPLSLSKERRKEISNFMEKLFLSDVGKGFHLTLEFLKKYPKNEQVEVLNHIIDKYLNFETTDLNERRFIVDVFMYIFSNYKKTKPGSIEDFIWLADKFDFPTKIEEAFEIFSKNKIPISYVAIARLSYILKNRNFAPALWDKLLKPYGLSYESITKLTLTDRNYLRLAEFLKNRNICFIAASYPSQSTATIKGYFSHRQYHMPHIFVDQEKSFKEKIRSVGYNKVFFDRFAGSFGHTTALGHKMIAQNIYNGLLEVSKKCPWLGYLIEAP